MTLFKSLTATPAALALGLVLSFGAVASSATASELMWVKDSHSSRTAGANSLAADVGPAEDTYCGPGFVACDAKFRANCKKNGGHMSGQQGWGGKTCWNAWKW